MQRGTVTIIIIAFCFSPLFIPISKERIVSYGIDTYSAHKPLFGNQSASERIITSAKTTGIGTILVDLQKKNSLTDVVVDIYNQNSGEHLRHAIIPKESMHDDMFAFADLTDNPIAKNTPIKIELSAPSATSHNPIGIRFDPTSSSLALAFIERVPLWKAVSIIASNHANDWKYIISAAAASLFIALPAWIGEKRWQWQATLAIVCLLGLAARLAVIPHFAGVSGGDAYNYLSITQSIIHGQNPFENTKRLPGYPLLLVPTFASGAFDDQYAMRITQIIAAAWGAIMISMLARIMKLSWPIALATAAILLFQKDYFWTSMRPEPYALYSALLLTALWLFIRGYQTPNRWRHVLFGLVLGYTAMTRQEGFVLAAVLGICSLSYELYLSFPRKRESTWILGSSPSMTRFLAMYLPALFVVLPFLGYNTIEYGNPLYTQYLEGDRLQVVDSFLALQDAIGATWGVIGSMWKPAWEQLERLSVASPLFIASGILLAAWYLGIKKTRHMPKYAPIVLGVVWIGVIWAAMYTRSAFTGIVPTLTAAWILISIPLFLWETRWKGIVILLVLLSQIGIATWFHPFPKHYQQSYPLIILMVATALIAPLPKQKIFTGVAIATVTLPFFITASLLTQKINAAIDSQNEDTALDSVTYRAARFARTLPEPIGFDQAYLPARLYFDPIAHYFPDEDHPTDIMQKEWLAGNPIRTLIDTNANHVFEKPSPSWKLLKTFKAAGKNEQILISSIYEIPH